jgi:hypothetical protein
MEKSFGVSMSTAAIALVLLLTVLAFMGWI